MQVVVVASLLLLCIRVSSITKPSIAPIVQINCRIAFIAVPLGATFGFPAV